MAEKCFDSFCFFIIFYSLQTVIEVILYVLVLTKEFIFDIVLSNFQLKGKKTVVKMQKKTTSNEIQKYTRIMT